jgi:mRNA interferase MazF
MCWYPFKAPDKQCPVLILTRNSAIGYLSALTITPLTTTVRDIPSEVFLTEEDGLLTVCAANMDNLQTVPKGNLGPLIAVLSPHRMQDVDRAIAFALGLPPMTGAG